MNESFKITVLILLCAVGLSIIIFVPLAMKEVKAYIRNKNESLRQEQVRKDEEEKKRTEIREEKIRIEEEKEEKTRLWEKENCSKIIAMANMASESLDKKEYGKAKTYYDNIFSELERNKLYEIKNLDPFICGTIMDKTLREVVFKAMGERNELEDELKIFDNIINDIKSDIDRAVKDNSAYAIESAVEKLNKFKNPKILTDTQKSQIAELKNRIYGPFYKETDEILNGMIEIANLYNNSSGLKYVKLSNFIKVYKSKVDNY